MPRGKKNISEERKLLIRLPKELHRQVMLLAYELNISMAELCREGLALMLKKHGKKTKISEK